MKLWKRLAHLLEVTALASAETRIKWPILGHFLVATLLAHYPCFYEDQEGILPCLPKIQPCMADRDQYWDGQGFPSSINDVKGKTGCWVNITLLLCSEAAFLRGLVIQTKHKPRNSSKERAAVQWCSPGYNFLYIQKEQKINETEEVYLICNFLIAQILWLLWNCHKVLGDIHNLKMSWKPSNGWYKCEGQWFGSRFLRTELQNTELVQLFNWTKRYFCKSWNGIN